MGKNLTVLQPCESCMQLRQLHGPHGQAGPGSARGAHRRMMGFSSGGGWAGHPDVIGRAAPVLKVTVVGTDPLRAAAHGGDSDCVSSSSRTYPWFAALHGRSAP